MLHECQVELLNQRIVAAESQKESGSMKKVQGSAHVIVIVCLVAALIAALGIVFYQNFIVNKSEQANEINVAKKDTEKADSTSKEALTNVAMNDVFSPGISFSYPSGWSATQRTQGATPVSENDMTMQTYTITSADKVLDVTVSLSTGGGLGGACNSDEVNRLDVFDTNALADLNGYSYVQYIYRDIYQSNQWVVEQGIGRTSETANLQVGSSVCDVSYTLIPPLAKMSIVASESARINTGVSRHGVADKVGYDSLNEAKAYLSSDTAKQVKAIFLSVR